MRRASGIFLAVAALAQTAAPPDRAAYQTAYRSWRAADPNLERDTTTGGATLGARADKVSLEAGKFYVARKAYLEAQEANAAQKAASVEVAPAPPEFDGSPARYAASQSRLINASIEAIANDPDRAIQRLRTALERERTALAALSSALMDTQKGYDETRQAAAAAEASRGKVTQRYKALGASLKQSASDTEHVGTLWTDYYRAFSDSARGSLAREIQLASTATLSTTPGNAGIFNPPPNPSSSPNTSSNTAPNGNPPASAPPPGLRNTSATPLPLSRYVGAWVYPTVGAEYHGPEPESVDMIVHEDNGIAKGTIVARFRLSASNPADPVFRINFEGPLQSTRSQSFPFVTAKGAKGTVVLNPGPAFNLISVSFNTEDKPGAIRQADFLLIKK